MTGSKRVDNWTSGTVNECSKIAGSPQAPPQQPTMLDVKSEGGPAASVKPGQKSCVRSRRIITLSARLPSDSSGRICLRRGHNDQSCWGHQCSKTTLKGESCFHKSTPRGLNPGPSWLDANGWTTGPVELCMYAVRLQDLHNSNLLAPPLPQLMLCYAMYYQMGCYFTVRLVWKTKSKHIIMFSW